MHTIATTLSQLTLGTPQAVGNMTLFPLIARHAPVPDYLVLDDEGIRMMKAKGTFLVPTLSASYPPPVFRIPDPESVRLRNQYKAFERAYAAGVKIAFGTDAGTFSHGDNAKEFGYMVQFGMQPMDAIRAATVVTADLFGISAEAGTIEPGKLADLIAVQGSPL